MILMILDNIFGVLQMLIIGMYFFKVHGAKNKWLSLGLHSVIGPLTMTVTDFMDMNQATRAIIVHLALFLILAFLYKGKISKKLITFFVYFLLSFACDFLVFTLTGAFGIKNELVFMLI